MVGDNESLPLSTRGSGSADGLDRAWEVLVEHLRTVLMRCTLQLQGPESKSFRFPTYEDLLLPYRL